MQCEAYSLKPQNAGHFVKKIAIIFFFRPLKSPRSVFNLCNDKMIQIIFLIPVATKAWFIFSFQNCDLFENPLWTPLILLQLLKPHRL